MGKSNIDRKGPHPKNKGIFIFPPKYNNVRFMYN
ncbi:hypothetical protein ACJIZ3_006476 [Penstemon smallii]|uniref:Uncharacterized protein n=1 Tax=Penstemon smallii TaxID=265156 RepID=A0ABD3S815_9LAMI